MRRIHFILILVLTANIYLIFTAYQITSLVTQKYFKLSPQAIYQTWMGKSPDKLFSQNSRTNILLIGEGGAGHSGGDLSDTLIMASIPLVKGEDIILLPIPRDLWIQNIDAKINTAYRIGEAKEAGYGITQLRQAVSQVTDLPIHYYIKLDFGIFSKFIDMIGGIDVEIQESFVDNEYPIPGLETAQPESSRYETISFTSGVEHMDGSRALKFVRSRHAQGQQGTDIARSQRQQQVIKAIRSQLLAPSTWENKDRLDNLYHLVQNSLQTDINNIEYIQFASQIPLLSKSNFISVEIPSNLGTENSQYSVDQALLVHPGISKKYYGQWVLISKDNDFTQVHQYINCKIYSHNDCSKR